MYPHPAQPWKKFEKKEYVVLRKQQARTHRLKWDSSVFTTSNGKNLPDIAMGSRFHVP
jgi:hypothetical protein